MNSDMKPSSNTSGFLVIKLKSVTHSKKLTSSVV